MTGGASVRGAPPGGATILAVEDEPRNAALLDAILGRAGYRLHVAPDLAAARAWLTDRVPDILLLDRQLPDGDGLSLVGELRGTPRLRHLPIVMVSASVLARDEAAALDAGCDAFLAKPVRVKPLLAEVRRQLAAAGTEAGSA